MDSLRPQRTGDGPANRKGVGAASNLRSAITSSASVVVVVSEGDFALTRVNSVCGKEVIVKRLPSWSVLQLLVLSVVISGLPATGIAQTRTPVILFPGYISTKLLVTVENQTVAPDCPASGTFGSWVSSDQSNGFSPACRDKLMTLVYNRQPSVPMAQRFSEQPGVTVTIMDYGKIESCPCPFYEDLYAFARSERLHAKP